MSDLPLGWASAKLSEVIARDGELTDGDWIESKDQDPGGPIRLLQLADIGDGVFVDKSNRFINEQTFVRLRCTEVIPGDVLVARMPDPLGRACLAPQSKQKRITVVDVAIVRPGPSSVMPSWLMHVINAPQIRGVIEQESTGTTRRRIARGKLASLSLPIPPLGEQQKIARKVDSLISGINSSRERLARVPQILKKFREAVLEAAVSGRLTEEWRASSSFQPSGKRVVEDDAVAKRQMLAEQPELAKKKSTSESSLDQDYIFDIPSTWVFTTWGKLSEWVTYGFTRPMPHVNDGVPLVTAKDVHFFKVMIDQTHSTSAKAFAELSDKDRPKAGDLLLTKDGTIGRAALVKTDRPFCINQSVAVVWLRSTSMNKRYLELVANARFTQEFIKDKAKGMAIQHLSITDFAQCPVPVPPASEQSEIVRRVDDLLAYADSLQQRYDQTVTLIEKLAPSALAKAFRGELVPQDPNDEPAWEMLERMRRAQDKDGEGKSVTKPIKDKVTRQVFGKRRRRLRVSSA